MSVATKGAEVVHGFRLRSFFFYNVFYDFFISHPILQVLQLTKCVVGMTCQSGDVPLSLDSSERFVGAIIVFVRVKTRDSDRLWNTNMRCPTLSCSLKFKENR